MEWRTRLRVAEVTEANDLNEPGDQNGRERVSYRRDEWVEAGNREPVIYTPVGGPVGVWWTPVDPPESGGLSLIIVYMTFWKYKLQYKSTGLRWSLAH
jgi:hypothetical protein